MPKNKKSLIMIAIILVAALGITLAVANPFKVTDPSDPRFDPDKFSFRDYSHNEGSLRDAFKKLFPIGTSKESVDHILIDIGGVDRHGCLKTSNLCSYYYPWYMQDMKNGAKIRILYDDNNNLICLGYEDGCWEKIKLLDEDANHTIGQSE